jgi:hypothetical protein
MRHFYAASRLVHPSRYLPLAASMPNNYLYIKHIVKLFLDLVSPYSCTNMERAQE